MCELCNYLAELCKDNTLALTTFVITHEPKTPMNQEEKVSVNILLADDDEDERYFFENALENIARPTHFTTVIDGERLMSLFADHSKPLPDVLFLDLNMPRKNGMECLKEIKENQSLKQIPVVMYSTSYREEIADVLYQTGAHYYLVKSGLDKLPRCLEEIFKLLTTNPAQPPRNQFILN